MPKSKSILFATTRFPSTRRHIVISIERSASRAVFGIASGRSFRLHDSQSTVWGCFSWVLSVLVGAIGARYIAPSITIFIQTCVAAAVHGALSLTVLVNPRKHASLRIRIVARYYYRTHPHTVCQVRCVHAVCSLSQTRLRS